MPTFPAAVEVNRESSYRVSLRALESQFGDGYRQRGPDGINVSQRTWQVSTLALDGTSYTEVATFLEDNAGGFFDWTPPLSSETVRVSCDGYEVQYVGGSTYRSISAEFAEAAT